jgi:hypothetical protein
LAWVGITNTCIWRGEAFSISRKPPLESVEVDA